jgi:hypothetical protein
VPLQRVSPQKNLHWGPRLNAWIAAWNRGGKVIDEPRMRGRLSLRFHLDGAQKIQLVFFNGRYSRYYRQVMDSMPLSSVNEPYEWSRIVTCSNCKGEVTGSTAQRTRTIPN